MPRKPMADKGMQTSLRLPSDLYDKLTEVAGDRGIGEEIRRRLQASIGAVEMDWQTRKLADAVAIVAQRAGWRNSRRGFAVFRAALGELLAQLRPPSEPSPDPTIERDAARDAGIALGTTDLGFGPEWGWELTSEEAAERATRKEENKP
jgi:hypothetical protein